MSVDPRCRESPDVAKRTYKLVKVGVKDAHNLTYEEFGYLYVHYPWVLPDVCVGDCE